MQVSVESFSPECLDYSLLEGKWLLVYTDAVDVVSECLLLICQHRVYLQWQCAVWPHTLQQLIEPV